MEKKDILKVVRSNEGTVLSVSAKYSCGFSNLLDSSIIVNER